jgi:signal transduction histidine kinase
MEATVTTFTFLQQVFDHQPEAAVYVMPVWQQEPSTNEKKIIDFQFLYSNAAIGNLNGQGSDQLLGKSVLADRLPDPGFCEIIFQQCLYVYQTGKPMQHSYFSNELEKYVTLQRVKFHDGVLTTARNRTEEYRTQVEKEQQTKLLQSLIESSPYGICLYESMRNPEGRIEDFKLRLCNQKSAEITALSLEQLQTHTVKELMVLRGHSSYFDICTEVVESGQPHYMEYYSTSQDQWLGFSFVKFEDGYLLNYIDITKTKKLEADALRNAHELQVIFNGSLSGVYSAKVIRDAKGMVSDLIFLRANEGFYKMFFATEEEVIGNSLLSISGGDVQDTFLTYVHEMMASEEPLVREINYHNPERWFEFSMVKLYEETLSVTVNDITSQKLAITEIERQRNLLDNILKQSPNGLSITKAIRDEQGNMVDAICVLMNEACEKFNGVPNEVMLNHSMGTLDPSILDSPLFAAARSLQTGQTFRTEYFLPLSKRWLELAVAKMDADHFINVFTDMTTMKESQVQMEQVVDELKRSNIMLEDFAYAASHDMKEPIRKIHFFADRLKEELKDQLNETQTKLFQRMEGAASRMRLLVDDLLTYSYVSKEVSELEAIPLNEKINVVLEDLELVVQEKRARITVGALPTIYGHRRQIQQLFHNLISNALKYSKENTQPTIHITSQLVQGNKVKGVLPADKKDRSYYLIQVKDNGIGFSQEDAERIFHVFTRLHGNSEYSGTGVGLAIVQRVIENHKGFIYAESSPGNGAVFNILWPA